MKITGFIFAAGLGTRLYPLTADRPKALVKYEGKTLLDIVLGRMFESGIQDVIVNIHHFPDKMLEALRAHLYADRIRISDERAYLRDTAGGLKFAEPLWNDSDLLLLHNVDILSDIDLKKLIDSHILNNAEATLAVRHRQTQRYFRFDGDSGQLCGWRNVKTGEILTTRSSDHLTDLAFSGIHVLDTRLARTIPTVEKSSITQFYLERSSEHRIRAYTHDADRWMDVGKYEEFHNLLS